MSEPLWTEKYRPRTISDTILPNNLKKMFDHVIESGEVKNMLFTGTAGLGKTTVAKAICNQLGIDHILINASESGNIDTLRGQIKRFATSVSLSGGYKVVILDEADYLNPQSFQPALRGFMEEFSDNCRFILTCNFKNKLIEPIHSRCGVYEFNVAKKDMPQLQAKFMKRLMTILKEEEVSVSDPAPVAELVARHSPDWRRIINECQRHSIGGELLLDALGSGRSDAISTLYTHLKRKDFKAMRLWVAENVDTDPAFIYRAIYDTMIDHVQPNCVPQLVLTLAEYSYKQAFVADQEINLAACFTEIMSQTEFK
jgi:DNA polymerase III delta prime subunit